jgi:outer membrane immunogenic protein
MRRFRWAALAAIPFVIGAGALPFSVSTAYAQCASPGGSNSATASSWVAGAQAGYNWQQGSWVYGLETDLSGTGLKSSMSGGLVTPCTGDFATTNSKIDWYGTFLGRVGWVSGNFLFYGTGGLAYGHVDLSSAFSTAGNTLNADTSSVRAGWVAGGGIEYLLRPDLTLNFGYQYVDLGTVSLVASSPPAPVLGVTANGHAAFSVVTLGFNWRFSPSGMTPMQWQGMYVGGHAGGAWGDGTDATYSAIFTSDIRLKRDIVLIDRLDDGLGLYRYRYLWSDTFYVGVMAQEVALIHPDAIVRSPLDGYLRVNYTRLGLHLMTLPEWNARSQGERL